MADYRLDFVRSLARQLAFAPSDVRIAQIAAAETLLNDIDPAKSYPQDFVLFRITGYQRRGQPIDTELFTGMALLISCLGLFGLSVFMAEQRNKEIGVRKVLGASVGALVGLLSADFVRLVLLSLLIAIPVSYYLMNRWLEEFAVRIAISWWMYALAGSIAVLVAFLTVSFQSVRAALSNPVQSLRSE